MIRATPLDQTAVTFLTAVALAAVAILLLAKGWDLWQEYRSVTRRLQKKGQ